MVQNMNLRTFILDSKGGVAVAKAHSPEEALGFIRAEDEKRPEGATGMMTEGVGPEELEDVTEKEGVIVFRT